MKEAIIKEIRRDDSKLKDTAAGDANGKKKRVRINKEKVDINNASNFQRGGNDRGHAGAQQGQGARPQGGNQPGGNNANNNRNRNKDRFKKPVIKQEVSEEDVAKQVKETLARLTSKGKNKGAKYRKENVTWLPAVCRNWKTWNGRKQGTEDYGIRDGQRVGKHDGCFCYSGHRHLYEHWYDGIHQPASGCRDHQLGG